MRCIHLETAFPPTTFTATAPAKFTRTFGKRNTIPAAHGQAAAQPGDAADGKLGPEGVQCGDRFVGLPEVAAALGDVRSSKAGSRTPATTAAPYNPVAPALANAIRDAIGVRPHELPMTRDRLWRLARDAARGAVGSPART